MKKLIKFFLLSFKEKQLFLDALYYLALYRIHIKTKQLQLLIQVVDRCSRQNISKAEFVFAPATISRLIMAGSRVIPHTTCLSDALAGKILFSKYGHLTKLHIGVLKNANLTVEGHAWLTLNGTVILGHVPNLEKYREFPLVSIMATL